MSTGCYAVSLYSKDETQNFTQQTRDASDVTRMVKQQKMRANYLDQKNPGAVPLQNLYLVAHTIAPVSPAMTLMAGLSYGRCVPTTNCQVPRGAFSMQYASNVVINQYQ